MSPAKRDGAYQDALGQLMREDGARAYEKLYFEGGPDTPNEAAMMGLANELRQRRQERKQRQF